MAYREVYRGYSDEEFLSDPAALTDWGFSPVEHNSREPLLRRLAGMAALTGVMGGAVGAIAFAGVGSRSAGLRATASATPRPAATRPTSAPTRRAHRGGRPRASLRGRSHSAARAARSVSGSRPALRRRRIYSLATHSDLPGSSASAARPETIASAQATVRAPMRSEFGFER